MKFPKTIKTELGRNLTFLIGVYNTGIYVDQHGYDFVFTFDKTGYWLTMQRADAQDYLKLAAMKKLNRKW